MNEENIDGHFIEEIETGYITTTYNDLWFNKLCAGLHFLGTLFIDLIYFYFFPFLLFCLYAIFMQVADINTKWTAPKDAPPGWDIDFSWFA